MKNKAWSFLSLLGLVCSFGSVQGQEEVSSSEYSSLLDKAGGDPVGIGIHNRVLFKIDDDHIVTTLDVIHKLNLLFYTSYPHLVDSYAARSQYYSAMWPVVLESVIDEFLMMADANSKKIYIDPTSVNQEIESVFGRDLSVFDVHFDMTPEDIFNIMHRTLVAQRVMGMMVRSKVMLKVTPGKIRERYELLAQEAAKTTVWKYRVITVKAATESMADQIANNVRTRLNETLSWNKERLSALVLSQGGQLICSDEFTRNDKELSDSHKEELAKVHYPEAICGEPQTHKSGRKLYVLLDKSFMKIGSLDEMENQIKQTLFMNHVEAIEGQYKTKLRERYGFDPSTIAQLLSKEAPPVFSLL